MKTIRNENKKELIKNYKETNDLINKLKAELKIKRDEIIGLIGDDKSIKADDLIAILTEKMRISFDQKAAKAAGVDVEKYQKTTTYNELKINEVA